MTDNEFFKNCIVEVVFFYLLFNSAIDQCIRVFPLYIEDKKDVVLLQRAKNNSYRFRFDISGPFKSFNKTFLKYLNFLVKIKFKIYMLYYNPRNKENCFWFVSILKSFSFHAYIYFIHFQTLGWIHDPDVANSYGFNQRTGSASLITTNCTDRKKM